MGIPMIGDKKPEQDKQMPSDDVPEGFIVSASSGDLEIYASAISVMGPVVRFNDAYVTLRSNVAKEQSRSDNYRRARNLMLFYSAVNWHDAPAPKWWSERAGLPEEP